MNDDHGYQRCPQTLSNQHKKREGRGKGGRGEKEGGEGREAVVVAEASVLLLVTGSSAGLFSPLLLLKTAEFRGPVAVRSRGVL